MSRRITVFNWVLPRGNQHLILEIEAAYYPGDKIEKPLVVMRHISDDWGREIELNEQETQQAVNRILEVAQR